MQPDLIARVNAHGAEARARQASKRDQLRQEHPELVEVLETFAEAFWAVPAKVTVNGASVGKSLERIVPARPPGLGLDDLARLMDERMKVAYDAYYKRKP